MHALGICNAYCFSTATMVTRTRLSVTFIRTLSVFLLFMLILVVMVSALVHNSEDPCFVQILPLFFYGSTAVVGLGLFIVEGSRSHSFRHTSLSRTPLDE
jgi:hypothetical protein